jgi:hypothetical protein
MGKPPQGVIFDCDMGNGIDDALALALLYGLDGKNETRVVSVSVSKSNLKSAAYCESVSRFYAGEVSGAIGAVGRTLPVGMPVDGKMPEDTPMLTAPLSRMGPDGKPVYKHGIEKLNDTADVSAVIRNALSTQYDQNCVVLLAGPATNLARILDLPGVRELAARKAKMLIMAAGAYSSGAPEFAIKEDITAARRVLADWPTEIVAVGREVGEALPFPGASIDKDFAWSQTHPVVDAYRAYKPMPYDASSTAMAAALYAVRPKEGYFQLSEPGAISVLDSGAVKFRASGQGKHRYLIADPAQKERVIKTYVELASAKPAPPRQRFRFNQQKKDDAPPKKQ